MAQRLTFRKQVDLCWQKQIRDKSKLDYLIKLFLRTNQIEQSVSKLSPKAAHIFGGSPVRVVTQSGSVVPERAHQVSIDTSGELIADEAAAHNDSCNAFHEFNFHLYPQITVL